MNKELQSLTCLAWGGEQVKKILTCLPQGCEQEKKILTCLPQGCELNRNLLNGRSPFFASFLHHNDPT